MRKGVSESDGSGSQHQPHYGGLDQHHHHQQQLVMHNLQSSQVYFYECEKVGFGYNDD